MSQQQTFAARLTSLREAKDWTRNALAVRAGVSPILLTRYERGERSPTLETAAKLARALGGDTELWAGLEWPEKKGGK